MANEFGHHSTFAYMGQDGNLYMNGASIMNSSGAQAAAMTAALTTITHTAPGTPDYAIQDLATSGYGFATKDEGNSVLKVVANLQVKVAEMEAILEGIGAAAAN